jgi:hypothetical protein
MQASAVEFDGRVFVRYYSYTKDTKLQLKYMYKTLILFFQLSVNIMKIIWFKDSVFEHAV